MSIESIREKLPEYAKDIKLNLSSVLRQTELSETQLWGTAVSCAMAVRNPELLNAVIADASSRLDEVNLNAAKTAGTLMAMNNIYYRYSHLAGDESLLQHPAKLRMNAIRSHGASPVDFELWCLAVSAVNGCGLCIESHRKKLKEEGLGDDVLLAAVRIGSVLQAAATVIETESAG